VRAKLASDIQKDGKGQKGQSSDAHLRTCRAVLSHRM